MWGLDGTVCVTRRGNDDVVALGDDDGDGRADVQRIFAFKLPGVHGVAVQDAELVPASSTTIWRTPLALPLARPRVIVSGLQDGGQHPNRTVRVGPDQMLWVSVGSSCNDCAEENLLERGTVIRYSADGSRREIVANGLRDTIGYDWHPVSGALWGMDHGADFHGDDVPPEELNEIVSGANYGWPVCYGQRAVDPMTNAPPERLALRPGQAKPDFKAIPRQAYCAQTAPSVLTLPAHSAPMAMRFYAAPANAGAAFPAPYCSDAFVALRGSWNRSVPVGYKVDRVRFGADLRPLVSETFLDGFLSSDGSSFFGRPTGLAIAADGALLVSGNSNGVIYRVAWLGR
ncbi:MAG: PQQ-dependent sugar dehydrogenase [Rubrivivax sp.]|nr:PQQ-dependent sugar dehydrogenase [Rubrivivax sp.]